jgi:hypothetical protein
MSRLKTTGKKQAGRFPKGVSGNAAGRPRGSLNRSTRLTQELLEGDLERLVRTCIDMALDGDPTALRLCIERLAPAPKDRPISFTLPVASTVREISAALAELAHAVAIGDLTPTEANSVAALLEGQRKVLESVELEQRVSELEKAINERKSS